MSNFGFNPNAVVFTPGTEVCSQAPAAAAPATGAGRPASPIAVKTSGDADEDLLRRSRDPDRRSGKPRPRAALTDFETVSAIGDGLVGQVYLVRRKADNQLYAMKVIPKELVANEDMLAHMKAERILQARMSEHHHPFLARLHFSFQDHTSLYLILEYVPGGDISFHLRSRVKLPEGVVRFIAAELCLALEHLHANRVVHRDVKAANVLLDKDGHIRLTDFGMSKQLTNAGDGEVGVDDDFQGARTYCGTLAYMAPEILGLEEELGSPRAASAYGMSVDWWSYGVLLHEMLTGRKPYEAETAEDMLQAISSTQLVLPRALTPEAAGFLASLLDPDPARRFAGAQVREHAFFQGLDWDSVLKKKIAPPWKPWCDDSDDEDVSNFPSSLTDFTPPTVQELGYGHADEPVDNTFQLEGFSYTGPLMAGSLARSHSPATPHSGTSMPFTHGAQGSSNPMHGGAHPVAVPTSNQLADLAWGSHNSGIGMQLIDDMQTARISCLAKTPRDEDEAVFGMSL